MKASHASKISLWSALWSRPRYEIWALSSAESIVQK